MAHDTGVQIEEQGTGRFKVCLTIDRRIAFPYPRASSAIATSLAQQSNTKEATVTFAAVLAHWEPASCYAQNQPVLQMNLVSYLLIQLPETIVKQAAGQAAKTQVGTESCRAGQQ